MSCASKRSFRDAQLCNRGAGANRAGSRPLAGPATRFCARLRGWTQDRDFVNRSRQLWTAQYDLGSVYCQVVSTRAIVAYTSPDGTWKGVWNDVNSEPQQLGRVLLRRIASLKGGLDRFVDQFIDSCPEGWIALDKNERCADPIGPFGGRFDGIVAT